MRKTTSIKISLFAFISTLICLVANNILHLKVVSYVCQGLGFLSYLFLLIWVSQIIYEKLPLGINLIVLFMSFSLAVYSLALFSLLPYEQAYEYYVIFFYFFSLTCLGSAILLVGRIIFGLPSGQNETPQPTEAPAAPVTPAVPVSPTAPPEQSWMCECGTQNSSAFCTDCGTAMPQQ